MRIDAVDFGSDEQSTAIRFDSLNLHLEELLGPVEWIDAEIGPRDTVVMRQPVGRRVLEIQGAGGIRIAPYVETPAGHIELTVLGTALGFFSSLLVLRLERPMDPIDDVYEAIREVWGPMG